MTKKLARLRALLEADPANPFGWYSLAMEQKKTDVSEALGTFEKVHSEFASYLPNYYHYAQTLADEAEMDRARTIYEEGIALAQKSGDAHAEGELKEALALL